MRKPKFGINVLKRDSCDDHGDPWNSLPCSLGLSIPVEGQIRDLGCSLPCYSQDQGTNYLPRISGAIGVGGPSGGMWDAWSEGRMPRCIVVYI